MPAAFSALTALSVLRIDYSTNYSDVYEYDVEDERSRRSPLPLVVPGLRHLQLTERPRHLGNGHIRTHDLGKLSGLPHSAIQPMLLFWSMFLS